MRTRSLVAATALLTVFCAASLSGCGGPDVQLFVPQANAIAEQVVALVAEWMPKMKDKPTIEQAQKEAEQDFIKAFKDKYGEEPGTKDMGSGADAVKSNAEKKVQNWLKDLKNGFNKAIGAIQKPNGVANQMFIYATCGELVGSSGQKPADGGYFKGPKVKLAGKDAICNDGTGADMPKVLFSFSWDVDGKKAESTIVLSIR